MNNQRVTLDANEAVGFATGQSREFAREVIQGGLLGTDVASGALEFDLSLAQLKVLRRHGLLADAGTEESAQSELLRRYAHSVSSLGAGAVPRGALEELEYDLGVVEILPAIDAKLDLARAYMDMGDSEAARSVLDDLQEKVQSFEEQPQTAEEQLQTSKS